MRYLLLAVLLAGCGDENVATLGGRTFELTTAAIDVSSCDPDPIEIYYLVATNFRNACDVVDTAAEPDPIGAPTFRLSSSAPVEIDGPTEPSWPSFSLVLDAGRDTAERYYSRSENNVILAEDGRFHLELEMRAEGTTEPIIPFELDVDFELCE